MAPARSDAVPPAGPFAPRRELEAAGDLTDVDAKIIALLEQDGRTAFATIARQLGLPTKTVSKRIAELRAAGVIDITVITDPRALGYHAGALIGLRLDRSRPSSQVADELWKLPYVHYLSVIGGRYDMLVEVVCRDQSQLHEIIEKKVLPVAGALEAEVFIYLSLYYQRFRYTLPPPDGTGPVSQAVQYGVRSGSLEFDAMDQRIIAELNADGRTPFEDVGSRLGVSESQVRRRVKRMVDSGGLRVTAVANPLSLGFETLAVAAITVEPWAAIRDVARRLSEVPSVIYIAVMSGRFNIVVELVSRDNDDLLRILDDEVRTVSGVASVEAWVHLDLHWRPLRPLVSG
jgi:DNA-binding Lrp family transcriptional regulator